MGVAVTSGVLASLESQASLAAFPHLKWESHTPGTSTPVNNPEVDPSLPSRFIACVKREESGKYLQSTFAALGGFGPAVEIVVDNNVAAVKESDVILLWSVSVLPTCTLTSQIRTYSCKPQLAHTVLNEPGIKDALSDKLLISILAGVTISQLSAWVLPTTQVVRAMPNTPCKVGPPIFEPQPVLIPDRSEKV